MAFFYITENVFYIFRSNFKEELSLISKNLKKIVHVVIYSRK
jgi:hypothetical protein